MDEDAGLGTPNGTGRVPFAPYAPRDWAWSQPLKAPQKVVLLAVAEAGDSNGVTFQGQARIAGGAAIPERTLRRRLLELEAAGLIVRYRRDRSNGSRTSDLIVLAMPREVPLRLYDYARVRERIGDAPPPGSANIDEADHLPAKKPTGQNGATYRPKTAHLTANMLAGPEGSVEELVEEDRARGELVPEPDAVALKAWFVRLVTERRGGDPPRVTAEWDRAARGLALKPRAELKQVVQWALGRPWWFNRINTLPKLAQHYPDLRGEWAAAMEQARSRPARWEEPPDRPKARRVTYDEERVRIHED